MVSDKIEGALKRIIIETQKKHIDWRPLSEFWNANINNAFFSSLICSYQNEFTELVLPDSFFSQKNGKTIFLIKSKWMSGKDGIITEHKEILVSASSYSGILYIPDYEFSSKSQLFDIVKRYWNEKCEEYNQEISDIFNVLSTFAGDNIFEED